MEGIKMNDHIPDATKMISDTPRTDAHNWKDGDYDDPLHAFYDFAGQLERELNAANEMFRKLNIHALNLTDRIRRLEEAGDALCAAAAFMGWHMEIEKWNKSKEAKP
jgi:hypothetical protein